MNIVIYGTGGVGGYFGARLAQAGHNVTFIARGKHLEAIQQKGLQLKSSKGDFLVYPANATEDMSEIKNIDLILVCVKTWQVEEVSKKIRPVLNENTVIISLLNGVENQDVLCSIIDKKHINTISLITTYRLYSCDTKQPQTLGGEK